MPVNDEASALVWQLMGSGTSNHEDSPFAGDFAAFGDEVRALAPAMQSDADRQLGPALDRAIAESAQTLRLLARHRLDRSERLLEIGSGLGLSSIFLGRQGFDITSVEPAGTGYDWHADMAQSLYRALDASHEHLTVPAGDIPPSAGKFDLIFSNNVVEHIDEPIDTLTHISTLLTPGGRLLHSCPNYSVPYEPHFGIPLLPWNPAATARILPGRIGRSDLWRSLNFIRAGDVRTWAQEAGLTVDFEQGQLASSIERLTVDKEFAARHRVMSKVAGVMVATRVTRALRRLPAAWSTPMEFTVAR